MGYDFALNDQELARSFSLRDDNPEDFFHSSGYAEGQNSSKIGTASFGKTVAERQNLNENRRFVRGYENASLSSQIAITRERTRGVFEQEQRMGAGSATSSGATAGADMRQGGETRGYRYHEDLARRQEMRGGGVSGREGGTGGISGAGRTDGLNRAGGVGSSGTISCQDYAVAAKKSFSQEQTRGGGYGGETGRYRGGEPASQGGHYGGGTYGGARRSTGYGGSSLAQSFKPDFGMKFGAGGK